MKTRSILLATTIAMAIACVMPARAQYYQLANQIPQMLQPALIGGLNYKGYAEASFIKGVGGYNADFLEVSTSQGFKYADWFFMGAGVGVDVMFAHSNQVGNYNPSQNPDYNPSKSTTQTGVVIPLYTDFRFNFGNQQKPSFYAGIKLGCSFLIGNNYIKVGDGLLSSNECFYLKPTVGVRIPTNKQNSKQAVSVGLSYQLMTSGYWYWNGGNDNITLNGLGATLSYEW